MRHDAMATFAALAQDASRHPDQVERGLRADLQAALDGLGLTYAPEDMLVPHFESGRLVALTCSGRLVADVGWIPPLLSQSQTACAGVGIGDRDATLARKRNRHHQGMNESPYWHALLVYAADAGGVRSRRFVITMRRAAHPLHRARAQHKQEAQSQSNNSTPASTHSKPKNRICPSCKASN